jgi:DNA-binding MarR family transcriptional regulator
LSFIDMRDDMDASEAITGVMLAVFRLNGLILSRGDQLTEEFGLTSARWQVLGAISLGGGPQSVPDIADRMGVTRQGAQKQVNMLEADGLVAKRANPRHQRSPLYALTAHGKDTYDRIMARYAEWTDELADGEPPGTYAQTLEGLRYLEMRLKASSNSGEAA